MRWTTGAFDVMCVLSAADDAAVSALALKVGTLGLSTILTAGAQGAIAYYSTYVVGQVAAEYLSEGKSWGEGGPKQVVHEILESLDKETVLREARREIRARLGLSGSGA